MEEAIRKMFEILRDDPLNSKVCNDLFTLIMDYGKTNPKNAHAYNKVVRRVAVNALKTTREVDRWFEMYKKTLLYDAKEDFDCYMLFLEIDRKPEERFYQPRRKILKQAVDAMQSLVDDELDELFISMPPRIGKTSLLMFFVTWLIGRNSEKSNLYSAYSDTITSAFYDGVMEIITDPHTYNWGQVFSESLSDKNAQLEIINIGRRKRYPSLTCRSLYGTLNGACDCSGVLMSDDLIGGIEEALNKDRMIAAWSKVDNNLIPRAKEQAKILWVGTRWSIIDPAGIRMTLLLEDERFKGRRFRIINLPALDEKDESNFDYDYGVGFSTEFYHQRRASFEHNNDMASWMAQYMGEPIEREGTLFTPDGFRYYNGVLPEGEPDRKFMAIDPAFGGGDFVAGPIGYQYGQDIYIVDVVYSNEEKNRTQPMIAEKALKLGDYIEVSGVSGTVDTIGLLSITVHTLDNQMVRIPNSTIINSNLVNYSFYDKRRFVFDLPISYGSDMSVAMEAAREVAQKCVDDKIVLPDPAPAIFYDGFGDAVKLKLAVWFERARLVDTKNAVYMNTVEIFKKYGVVIPFTRYDISIVSDDKKPKLEKSPVRKSTRKSEI